MNKRETDRVPASIVKQMTCGKCNYFDESRIMCTFHQINETWISVKLDTQACFDYRPLNLDYTEVDLLIAEQNNLNQIISDIVSKESADEISDCSPKAYRDLKREQVTVSNDSEFDNQYLKAKQAAEQLKSEPLAVSAFFDPASRLVVVHLNNGAIYQCPTERMQGLQGASQADLSNVNVTPMGDGLHWETLDADFSVAGLLNGKFGSVAWMDGLNEMDAG